MLLRHVMAAVISTSLLFSLTTSYAALPAKDSQGETLPTIAPMLERVTPAVVNIATSSHVRIRSNPLFDDPFFRRFFDMPGQQKPQQRQQQSLGSGVIVDADKGYILTNHHVISNAEQITVTLRNGNTYQAKLIGTDPDSDIAVIQVKAENLTAIPIANTDNLRVGDFAVAIGNPFGLGQTVTSGIVSALGRSGLGIHGYENFIQTDASINPGNSGGALVNLNGELIGINSAIYSKSGGNIGIGFAIPMNMASNIMQQLIAYGEVKRGQLGAQAQDVTPELAQAFGLKQSSGAVITDVVPNSAADRAGLRIGDIVTEINGSRVRNANTLRNKVGLLRIGDKVEIAILRKGKAQKLSARVEEHKVVTSEGKEFHAKLKGASLSDIGADNELHGRIQGVLVVDVEQNSPAWQHQIRPGDIITSANDKRVSSLAELKQALKKKNGLALSIRRGHGSFYLYFQ